MHILSFDVGIKHLAYCLLTLEEETETLTIADWNVVDLCNTEQHLCARPGCKHYATYYKKEDYFCKTHAKRHEHYVMPTSKTSLKHLRACKVQELRDIWSETDISSNLTARKDIFEALRLLYERTVFDTVQKINASNINLIKVGVNMKDKFDSIGFPKDIEYVIIENQISPIANRMKTLQGMITQYFIMKDYPSIEYVSSANKLKFLSVFATAGSKNLTYKERKKLGIRITDSILTNNVHLEEWLSVFKGHRKSDDLADAFLQGLWFGQQKGLFNASYLKL
jgi:hypothetical protein